MKNVFPLGLYRNFSAIIHTCQLISALLSPIKAMVHIYTEEPKLSLDGQFFEVLCLQIPAVSLVQN